MKRTAIKGGLILAAFGLLSKLVGAFYRVPLTNLLGAEGLGAYQMVFPVYALAVAVTSSAVPVLVARTLPTIEQPGLQGAFFSATLKYSLIVGILCGGALCVFARLLAALQGSELAFGGYLCIAPSLIFVALLSAFRGWFNSRLETVSTAVSGLCEQAVKLSGLVGAYFLLPYGLEYAVCAALGGITLAEIMSCALAVGIYVKRGGRFKKIGTTIPVKSIAVAALPLTVGGLIFPLTVFADSIMTVRLLILAGTQSSAAVEEYGILSGSVGTLINLPVSLALSFAVTVVPVIAECKRRRNIGGIKKGENTSLKAVLIISLPCAVGLAIAARPIVNLLYGGLSAANSELAVLLIRLAVFEIPLASVLQLFGAYLQALDRSALASRNMAIAAGIKLLANFSVLIVGVSGIILSTLLCYAVCAALDIYAYKALTGRSQRTALPQITLSVLATAAVVYFIVVKITNNALSIALSLLLGGLIYGIMLLLSGAVKTQLFSKRERLK